MVVVNRWLHRTTEVKFELDILLAVWPWVNYLHFLSSEFLHPQEGNNSIYLAGLLEVLNDLMHIKCFKEYPAYSKPLINKY